METIDNRIEELENENERLRQALYEKNFPDASDHSWSQNIIDSLPNPLFIKNKAHKFVTINQAFSDLLNQKREDLLGTSDYDNLTGDQSDYFWKIDSEILTNGGINWNEEELTIGGTSHNILTSKTRIRDAHNEPYILGVITDITENKNQQKLLRKKNNVIETQQKNVQTLLKEIHHRVKNNMQIVSSLLNMQMNQFEDIKVRDAFRSCKNRIISMANVHEILYQTNNFADINFELYLDKLIMNLRESYNLGEEVKFNIGVSSLFLNIEKAIPLGLIINEIITNAIKHAVPEKDVLNIHIKFNCTNNVCHLNMGDDGVGMKANTQGKGLGMELIQLLSDQLNAKCERLDVAEGVSYQLTYITG